MLRSWSLLLVAILVAVSGIRQRPASAIPLFAHQYGVTCEKCHSVIPHLNEFGTAFMASGYRIPGLRPGSASPIAGKVNLADSSEYQGPGLPKAIVDEIEAFTAGAIGSRASYLIEQYIVDGGVPGLTRDAWAIDRVNPWQARIPVYVQAGSFTLPLPVDPETFRDSAQHYTVYDQTVGSNPFNFFDPKIGARAGIGDSLRGLSVQLFAGPGHDRQSGLPSTGTDWMGYAQHAMGPFTLSLYRYAGTRPLADGSLNRFERTGYALAYNDYTHWEIDNVVQTGWDSNCSIPGSIGCASSGGFTQLRYTFNNRLFAEGRYEGTNDPSNGFTRDAVFLLGYGPTENSRITLEDVIQQHVPQTTHTMNLQFTIAY
jgi:hypothetical protein